ncbi:MAG: DNA repair protein RadC [Taibaiella sp.]|jgi:DNA repair protein RadC
MENNEQQKPNSIKHWAEDDRPREKMLHKGYAALSDAELIAILIQSGTREKSAVDLAREILQLGNQNLTHLGKLTLKDFQKVKGIGEARAITLAAALELGRRRQIGEGMEQKEISSSRAAADILIPLMGDLAQEKFCVLCLSASNKLVHYEFVSSGGLTSTIVDPKLVFKIALQHMASRLIVAHNHPSGNMEPSTADKQITDKLKAGAKLLDMQLMDHIIIADKKHFSFADKGLL